MNPNNEPQAVENAYFPLGLLARDVTRREDAEALCDALGTIIERLDAMMAEETALFLTGAPFDATAQAEEKAALTDAMALGVAALKRNHAAVRRLAADALADLQARQEHLRRTAEDNLPAVTRARDISHRLMKGIQEIVARKTQGPTTYGASGQNHAPRQTATPALSVSRAL